MISQRIIQNVQGKNFCLFTGHYLYNMRIQIPVICWWFPKKFSPDLSCLKLSVTWDVVVSPLEFLVTIWALHFVQAQIVPQILEGISWVHEINTNFHQIPGKFLYFLLIQGTSISAPFVSKITEKSHYCKSWASTHLD